MEKIIKKLKIFKINDNFTFLTFNFQCQRLGKLIRIFYFVINRKKYEKRLILII